MKSLIWMGMCLCVGTVVTPWGARAESPTEGLVETVITSDRLEFEYAEFFANFDGNVVIKDPMFTMTADRVIAFFEGTNDVRQVTAVGHVTLVSGDRRASCNKAVYQKAKGQIVMTGEAALSQAGDTVSGDQITIWLNDQRIVCEPAARLVIRSPAAKRSSAVLP